MDPVAIGEVGCYIRQSVAAGKDFDGTRTRHLSGTYPNGEGVQYPSATAMPDYAQTLVYETYTGGDASAEGLFEFDQLLAIPEYERARPAFFIDHIVVALGPAVNWQVYATSGIRITPENNVPGELIDDTDFDIEIGTGTGNAIIPIEIPLHPGMKIRVITSGGATLANGYVQVMCQKVLRRGLR